MKVNVYNSIVAAVMALISFLLCSCSMSVVKVDDSEIVEKTFPVSDFNGIEASGIDVIYTVSDTTSVMLRCPENCLNDVVVEVAENGTLRLCYTLNQGLKNVVVLGKSNADITAYVSGPSLEKLYVNGSSEFECKDVMVTRQMIVNVAGSGDIDLSEVKSGLFECSIQGSGDVSVVKAVSENAKFSVAGSGDIEASMYDTKYCEIDIAGSGDISLKMNNCDHAKAEIAGSGEIELTGELGTLDTNIAGSGKVETKNLKLKNK